MIIFDGEKVDKFILSSFNMSSIGEEASSCGWNQMVRLKTTIMSGVDCKTKQYVIKFAKWDWIASTQLILFRLLHQHIHHRLPNTTEATFHLPKQPPLNIFCSPPSSNRGCQNKNCPCCDPWCWDNSVITFVLLLILFRFSSNPFISFIGFSEERYQPWYQAFSQYILLDTAVTTTW